MARRIPEQQNTTPNENAEPGGASGVVVPGAIDKVSLVGESTPSKAKLDTTPVDVKVTRYITEGNSKDGHWVMYAGQRIKFHDGKMIDTASYDVALLQRQGLKMREIES